MDFDLAAQRLARDQSQLHSRKAFHSKAISRSAQRAAEQSKRLAEQRVVAKRQQQLQRDYQAQYIRACQRKLNVQALPNQHHYQHDTVVAGQRTLTHSILLQPTSIHGQGDKIALPPSILEFLTHEKQQQHEGPWTFRIGLLNPDYTFPASPLLQQLRAPEDESTTVDVDDPDSDHETSHDESTEAYLDELRYQYLAYTHATVVEFTQDEGFVGLPAPVAAALLASASEKKAVPVMRTVDPAKQPPESAMDVEVHDDRDDQDAEKTPGHLAYGAFDLPNLLIEVSLVTLPKAKACTLVPSVSAIENGFYSLSDMKHVLEQSLIRTRATLSTGDVVSTWHRGKQFDLVVAKVEPATFQAVLCINTDIEVEFGANPNYVESSRNDSVATNTGVPSVSTGRTLSSKPFSPVPTTTTQPARQVRSEHSLLPEPDITQTENVCSVQIKTGLPLSRDRCRRRFDVQTARVEDLFLFAQSLLADTDQLDWRNVCLVTRFPRRVISLKMASQTLSEAGLRAGQELLMLEKVEE